VRIKLINFNVSVLGEVERPGVFYVYNNSLSVFSALSLAGDITEFGDRRKVYVIRKKGTEITKVRLNLHDPNVITSEYYYCLPNDVIYVEPDKSKATHINLPIAALVISSLSFVLLVFNIVNRN
jgi:polysaccharide export outer membrane protein